MKNIIGIIVITIIGLVTLALHSCSDDGAEPDNEAEPDNGIEYGTVKDIDGNEYKTVTIGDQEWMAENLRVTSYNNGDAIPKPPPTHEWILLTSGAYCWYNTSYNTYGEIYGALYNWYAVKNNHGLCPTGWHVPSDAEWAELVDYVVAQGYPNESDNPNGAGNALKSCRQASTPLGGDCATSEHPRWDSHDTHYGFDEFGFSGLPGGQFIDYPYIDFGGIGEKGRWWSSTQSSSDKAWNWILWNKYGDFHGSNTFKYFVYSVRCVRDLD